MITDERTWVLVADGGAAKVMQFNGPDGTLELVPDGEFDQPNLPSRDLVTDDRGRGFAGKGISQARGAMEYTTDPHRHEEQRFVSHVADFLDQHVTDYDHLIVMAAPRALGNLRDCMSKNVQSKVYAEMNKDLTNMPLDAVRKQLQDVLHINERH